MKVVSSVLPKAALRERLKVEFPEAEFLFYRGIKQAEEDLADADIYMTDGSDLTDEIVRKMTSLKWIMVLSAGVEDMPLQTCAEKGIIVTNARGIHKIPMAEYTIGMMLQHEKKMQELLENERQERWDRKLSLGELSEKTILILGAGSIGMEIARLAKAFRMQTVGMNRSGHSVSFFDKIIKEDKLKAALADADYVVAVLPSTEATTNLLKEEHFRLMKNSAVFINIGRGNVVKEETLLRALNEKEISHMFLDVFKEEPLREGHPFWQMENVTVTPHISSITTRYVERALDIFIENFHAYKQSEKMVNIVDANKGY